MAFKYCKNNEASVFETVNAAGKGVKIIDKILLGSYVTILGQNGNWFNTRAFGKTGWMNATDLTDEPALKVFYLDVGQGDGCLLEIDRFRMLIDAGAGDNMYNYLTKYHFKSLLNQGFQVHIDFLIVSHFDRDHFKGFAEIINDRRFTFGEVCHAGILKFLDSQASPSPYNTGLGDKIKVGTKHYLTKFFEDLLVAADPAAFNTDVTPFLNAIKAAKAEGRISSSRRLSGGDTLTNQTFNGKPFRVDVLGPFTESIGGSDVFRYWTDDGITINGHSLVLNLTYGTRTYQFGGDLNEKSQEYLIEKYPGQNPFQVDVAKSCHHGSNDFSVDFMKLLNPYATVISSGDNETFAHPRADAIGCAGRYSRGERPLVFSTELARSTNIATDKIVFGMINSRCDGNRVYFSQMKEASGPADRWDSYEVNFI